MLQCVSSYGESIVIIGNKGIAPIGRHDKPPPPSVGYGARFTVAEGNPRDPRMFLKGHVGLQQRP